MIEAVIALAVLVTVLAGVAGVWVMTSAATAAARRRTLAVQLARDKVEQLASLTWRVRTVAGVDVFESDESTDPSRRPASGGGFGTRASPMDSLSVSRPTYADYLDARGEWIGSGVDPPSGARFVRRWWIGRSGVAASELLVFQVMVTTIAAAAKRDGVDGWWRLHPEAVWVCGAKLRRGDVS